MEMLDDPLAAGGPETRAQRWILHQLQQTCRDVVHIGAVIRDAWLIEDDAVPSA
jgi:hypothetical protein